MRWYIELVIEEEEDGRAYHGYCPFLKGLHVGGQDKEETLKNLGDAVSAYLQTIMTRTPFILDWHEIVRG